MNLIDAAKQALTGAPPATDAAASTEAHQYDLSFYCITRHEDREFLPGMIQSLPRGVELVLCNTVPTKDDAENGTVVLDREEELDGRFVRFCTYRYKSWDFATARNAALAFVQRGWCFWVDTDDRLLPFQHDDIVAIPTLMPPGVGGVMVGCFGYQPPYQENKRGLYYSTVHCRAHRNHPAIRWRGLAHEQIEPQINDLGYKVIEADIAVYHVGYVCSKEDLTAKMGRNVRLLCQQIAQDPQYLPQLYVQFLRDNSSTYLELKEATDGR